MKIKCLFFAIGLPDPSYGGSGIVNYFFCEKLLREGHKVKAIFVSSFEKTRYLNSPYVKRLTDKGLEFEVLEPKKHSKKKFGFGHVANSLSLETLNEYLKKNENKLLKTNICFSTGLGWAISLANLDVPKISFNLQDDILDLHIYRLRQNLKKVYSYNPILTLKLIFQVVSLWIGYNHISYLLKNHKNIHFLGTFSPDSASKFQRRGIICKHVKAFTPLVSKNTVSRFKASSIRLLSLGSLETTYGGYFKKEIDKIVKLLERVDKDIIYNIVGKSESTKAIRKDNLFVNFQGFVKDLDKVFNETDVLINPINYPIGVRTRIITAMSYGIPVISHKSACLGLPELTDKVDILYYETPEQFINLMKLVARDNKFVKKVALNALQSCKIHYDAEKNIDDIIKYAKTLLR